MVIQMEKAKKLRSPKQKINLLHMSPLEKKRIRHKITQGCWSVFRALLLIGLSYVIIYPILYMLTMGFRDVQDLYDTTVHWIPKHFTLDNFVRVFEGMDYPQTLLNTVVISLGCSLLLLVCCSMTAYGLSRFNFRGHGFVFILVLVTIVVPQQFFVMASYENFGQFKFFGILNLYNAITGSNVSVNLLDTYWSFLLPAIFGIGIRSGLYIYIFHQFFKGLPRELEEAAYIDGCGFIRTFLKVIVPSAVPAFVTVFLFSFVWHWNDYQLSSRFMAEAHRTLSGSLVNLQGLLYQADATFGDISTIVDNNRIVMDRQIGSLLVVGPVILLYLALQKFFTESIERTGLVE